MSILSLLSLLAGVAIFMFGMLLIKYSLSENFNEKTEALLKKFTSDRFSATLTGTVATAALQSSSASSVITAALVDSGKLSLYSAFWIIVGANLGTTFTGLLTAASFSDIAPFMCIVGTALLTLTKSKRLNGAGIFFMGFGLLFVGMATMKAAVGDIRNSEIAYDILQNSSSPVTGLLTGCFFTALIQSSAATTALLQTLAEDGLVGIRQCFYILLGANIGTCATCVIASSGLGSAAKRVSQMHTLYNFFGSVFFVLLSLVLPLPEMAEMFFPGDIKMQTGVLNVFFNLAAAVIVLLLPVKRFISSEKSNKINYLHSFPPVLKCNR